MFKDSNFYPGIAAKDLDAARAFYGNALGLAISDGPMGILKVQAPKGYVAIIYPKPDHQPANYTVMNFPVDSVEAAVDALIAAGVAMEHYGPEFGQDDKGISRGKGPDIAWFKDPSGNILSVLQATDEDK